MDINETPKGDSIRVPDSKCIQCGTELGMATAIGDGSSKEYKESVSICAYCGNIAVFTKDRTLRPPTKEEVEEVKSLPDYQEAMRILASVKRMSAQKKSGIGPWTLPT